MLLVLIFWVIGSALFLAGWLVGAIMASRHVNAAADAPEFCQACFLRQVAAQVDAEPISLLPPARH